MLNADLAHQSEDLNALDEYFRTPIEYKYVQHMCSKTGEGSGPNLGLQVAGLLVVHCAANRDARAEDLPDGAAQVAGAAAVAHDARDLNHVIHRYVTVVKDVLLLRHACGGVSRACRYSDDTGVLWLLSGATTLLQYSCGVCMMLFTLRSR